MKWLVIIAILIVIAVAMVWLRTVRQGPGTVESREPHRIDDSVIPPTTLGLRPDTPSTSAGSAFGGGGTRQVPEEPGSDFAWEPEITGTEESEAQEDPPPPGTRPEA
jgi:hypothetical protein